MQLQADAICLVTAAVDMRTDADGRSLYIRQELERPPCDGSMYVFTNRARTRMKLACWDGTGVWLCQRRLHEGRFVWPKPGATSWHISAEQWQWLTMGVDWQRLAAPAPAQWQL